MATKKIGRPRLPAGERKKMCQFRATGAERELYDSAAEREGMSLSDWIRKHLTKAAKKRIV